MSKNKLTSVALILAATPMFAQNADIDINGDGMYSYPELQAFMPEMTEDTFAELDISGDGLLDAEEIAAGVAAGVLPS
ncbi:hypothetical protein [Yoonia litorea]|uniref:EF hand n=1 Tax=Yoonia litorea TaxID=1123755 RepID=A0A1I6LXY7_9RHOB|nr:hypothetical protein [Yoonia litorea]SFS08339.1 EF hand [Yoonia litorea]